VVKIATFAKPQNVTGNSGTAVLKITLSGQLNFRMKNNIMTFRLINTLLLIITSVTVGLSCSMFKITKDGKTMVGNNEDFSNPNSRIWFERASLGKMGVVYLGFDDLEPQGGMNEAGLVFDGFAVDPRPHKQISSTKIAIDLFPFKEVMSKCKNVDDVYTMLNKYNLSIMDLYTVFYVDKMGNYLIVEPDTLIKGNKATYALSNFCPSVTSDFSKVDLPYFQKGRQLLENKTDTSIPFCASVADSMHQSWQDEIGGTLYSTIYDLDAGTIDLYFYHDFSKSIKFNLKNELQKRDTILIIPKMFLDNKAGQKHFSSYNTAKKQIEILKNKNYAKDTTKINALLKNDDLRKFLPVMEDDINNIGYDYLLKYKKYGLAVNVLKINTEFCPWSSNAFDSLGEAYFKNKQYALALKAYNKSVEKNPNNDNGKKQIIKLEKLINTK
jgi:tetratricopeptide (TPR) repeat protein